MSSLMSVEEVMSLTVPKLKAELTRLNQPIAGLKRKAQFVEALTTYIEQQQQQQQQQQQEPPAQAAAEEVENAPDDAVVAAPVAQSAEESATDDQSAPQQDEPAQEAPPAVEEPEPMDVATQDSGSKPASAVEAPTAVQDESAPAPATAAEPASASPAQTPVRASRKRTTRGEDEEASSPGKPGAAAAAADDDGADGRQKSPRVSPAAKRKKVSEDAPPEPVEAAEESTLPPPQQQEKEQQEEQAADNDNRNGTAANGNAATKETAAVAVAGDPMEDEGAAPSSEPVGAAAAGQPAASASPAGDDGVGAATDVVEEKGGGEEDGSGEAAAADPVTIRVDNFVRPFTAPMAKKLLEDKAGAPVLEGGFWMDSIKTHCYATFAGKEEAERAIAALQGLQWPPQSFKRLEAKIGDMSAEEARARDDTKRSSRPLSAKKRPVLGPRVGERKKKMEQDGVGPRTTPIPADHIEAVSAGRGGGRTGVRGNGGGGASAKKEQEQVEYNCFCFPAGEDEPPVFVPDAKRNKFVVVGMRGASVRKNMRLDSPVMKTLRRGTIVVVSEIRHRRAHITKPLDGWASISTEDGYQIIEPTKRSTKYKVIYDDGIIVRSTARIETGAVVKIATPGSILKATGKTQIVDGIERVQIDRGWVSMRLREDNGLGPRLLAPMN
eukprot:g9384.t1